jgi:hypothetical protein
MFIEFAIKAHGRKICILKPCHLIIIIIAQVLAYDCAWESLLERLIVRAPIPAPAKRNIHHPSRTIERGSPSGKWKPSEGLGWDQGRVLASDR